MAQLPGREADTTGRKIQVFDLDLSNQSPVNALKSIEDLSGFHFAYEVSLPSLLNPEAFISYHGVTVVSLMEALTSETSVRFLLVDDQIILRRTVPPIVKTYLIGQIIDDDTLLGIPYATIEIKSRNVGVVADYCGRFKLNLRDMQVADTLLVSSMGYERRLFSFDEINFNDSLKIYLKEKAFLKREITIKKDKYLSQSTGTRAGKPKGETYVDTHGQQTALFVPNQEGLEGKIEKVRYYLSPKGNTHAPFRVHIYAPDSAGKGPGLDMIPVFLVVKPDIIRGWYEVDVFEYEIDIPENGFYVALEGVFPNDPRELLQTIDQTALKGPGLKKRKDQMIRLLSYGQRIGFR
ncbi:MAG: carboxypeptidase-like regulatory domain-containing protein, partial [Bacteroidota bacterium]